MTKLWDVAEILAKVTAVAQKCYFRLTGVCTCLLCTASSDSESSSEGEEG